jgi:hypothetical protein
MQRVVCGVQIQDDLGGCLRMRFQEQLHPQRLDGGGVGPDLVISIFVAGLLREQLQPVQRALACHRRAVRALCLQLSQQRPEHRVVPQLLMIVQILVPQRQAKDALADQRAHRVLDQVPLSSIAEAAGQSIDQADRRIRLAQQQCAGIRTDRAAVKGRDHSAPINPCKLQLFRNTLCRHRGSPVRGENSFWYNKFCSLESPMHLSPMRNPG